MDHLDFVTASTSSLRLQHYHQYAQCLQSGRQCLRNLRSAVATTMAIMRQAQTPVRSAAESLAQHSHSLQLHLRALLAQRCLQPMPRAPALQKAMLGLHLRQLHDLHVSWAQQLPQRLSTNDRQFHPQTTQTVATMILARRHLQLVQPTGRMYHKKTHLPSQRSTLIRSLLKRPKKPSATTG